MDLKIGIIYRPPASTRCSLDRDCRERGNLIDAMLVACLSFEINCTFSWYQNSDYGDSDDTGVGTGLVGAIQRGEYDTSLPVYTPSYTRFKAIQFSDLYSSGDLILLTKSPSHSENTNLNFNILLVFQWSVWLTFFCTLFLSVATMCSIRKYLDKETIGLKYFFELSTLLITTNEFPQRLLRFDSLKILAAFWLLTSLVIDGAYTGSLFSRQVVSQRKVPFADLESFLRCLEKFECRLISHTTTIPYVQELIHQEIDNRFGERFKTILKNNPLKIVPVELIPETILQEKNQYLVNVGSRQTRLSWILGNEKCQFYLADLFYAESSTFPVAKNSSKLRLLNKIATSFREHGLIEAIDRKYFRQSISCEKKFASKDSQSQSRLLCSTAAVFLFYFLGIFSGTIALIAEKLRSSLKI